MPPADIDQSANRLGCANVAGMFMVRALNRQRELAIRKALGATRMRILRPLLAEGLVLVLSGAGLGLVLDAFLRDRLSDLRWPSACAIPFDRSKIQTQTLHRRRQP